MSTDSRVRGRTGIAALAFGLLVIFRPRVSWAIASTRGRWVGK